VAICGWKWMMFGKWKRNYSPGRFCQAMAKNPKDYFTHKKKLTRMNLGWSVVREHLLRLAILLVILRPVHISRIAIASTNCPFKGPG